MQIENLILNVLTKDVEFAKKVRPHLKAEYFQNDPDKVVYSLIEDFYSKYSQKPPKDSLLIELDSIESLNENVHTDAIKIVKDLYVEEFDYSPDWLLKESEKFCKDRAVFNAIMESVKIINGESKTKSEGAIPKILSDALSIAFDVHVGHDYFADIDSRYDFYNKKEIRFKTGLSILNKVTGGGLPIKTLVLLLAATGGGKSAVKCSMAADFIRDGHDVLYISMELAEERVAERIDANLLNLPIGEVKGLSEAFFKDKMSKLRDKSYGKLVIKEYPTGAASVNNFNALMEELKTKKGFVPKIIFVDYLQICCSASHRGNSSMNTYNMQKYIAEELRGFAVEHEALVISSVQTNRSGFNVSDLDESAIADSAGILFTADAVFGIIRTDEMKEQNQVMFKQIKNRFGDPSYFNKFICNMDTSRMKVSDVEDQGGQKEYGRKEAPVQSNKASKPKSQDVSDWDFET